MRKYYDTTIEKTYHTSRGALEKMIASCHCNIGKPIHIEKVDDTQKTFSCIWAKQNKKKKLARRAD